jgi:hypothetical protein
MTSIEKLLSIASVPLGPELRGFPDSLRGYDLGSELFDLLQKKNGFYVFESALHVFPLGGSLEPELSSWNASSSWRDDYGDLAEGLLFFAEDILQDQFCLSMHHHGVLRFQSETGQVAPVAGDFDEWARVLLADYPMETGWTFAHEWQKEHGPFPAGKRLMPKKPFFLGGDYNLANLWAGDSLEGIRFKADLARQTRELPDGATLRLHIDPKASGG